MNNTLPIINKLNKKKMKLLLIMFVVLGSLAPAGSELFAQHPNHGVGKVLIKKSDDNVSLKVVIPPTQMWLVGYTDRVTIQRVSGLSTLVLGSGSLGNGGPYNIKDILDDPETIKVWIYREYTWNGMSYGTQVQRTPKTEITPN